MNEQQWRDSTDVPAMLRFLNGGLAHPTTGLPMQQCSDAELMAGTPLASDRKLRLACCAMLRTVWASLPDQQCRNAVRAAEGLADDWDRRIWSLHQTALSARLEWYGPNDRTPPADWQPYRSVSAVMHAVTDTDLAHAAGQVAEFLGPMGVGGSLAGALRDVVNPFVTVRVGDYSRYDDPAACLECQGTGQLEPTRFDGADAMPCPHCGETGCRWITPLVRRLAEGAYNNRLDGLCPECSGTGQTHDAYLGGYSRCDRCGGAGSGDGRLDDATLAVLADALEDAGWPIDEVCPACKGNGEDDRFMRAVNWHRGKAGPSKVVTTCPGCLGTGRIPNHVLAHLRSAGPHWLGCWALDLVTGNG